MQQLALTQMNQQQLIMQSKKALSCFRRNVDPNYRIKFTPEEDELLKELVRIHGENEWTTIANKMKNRTSRQCRERYRNYLAPSLKNGPWTPEEDALLKEKFAEYGPKWASIAKFFKERSDVNIKNHWTAIMNKQQKKEKSLLGHQQAIPVQYYIPVQAFIPFPGVAPQFVPMFMNMQSSPLSSPTSTAAAQSPPSVSPREACEEVAIKAEECAPSKMDLDVLDSMNSQSTSFWDDDFESLFI